MFVCLTESVMLLSMNFFVANVRTALPTEAYVPFGCFVTKYCFRQSPPGGSCISSRENCLVTLRQSHRDSVPWLLCILIDSVISRLCRCMLGNVRKCLQFVTILTCRGPPLSPPPSEIISGFRVGHSRMLCLDWQLFLQPEYLLHRKHSVALP